MIRRFLSFFLLLNMVVLLPGSAYAEDSNKANSEAALSDNAVIPDAEEMCRKISELTDGHVRYYDIADYAPMDIYGIGEGNSPEIIKTIQGSNAIPLHQSDLINIICGAEEKSTDIRNGEFYLYFYDSNGTVIWDYLDETDAVTGEKNRVSVTTLKGLNGFQFSGIPEGTCFRFAKANGHACKVLVWDGDPFGYPLFGLATAFQDNAEKEKLPQNNTASIQIPETALYLIAKPGYTFLNMITSNGEKSEPVSFMEYRFPSQVVNLRGFGGAGRHKNISIVKDYNYATGEYAAIMPAADFYDYVAAIDGMGYSLEELPSSVNQSIYSNIRACMNFKWTAAADVVSNDGETSFHQGVTYQGIPYRSAWTTASNVGWHVSKQTFMNAANDPDSIFYHNTSTTKVGPYYSLVCSSFATLVRGFSYPMTNFSMMKDPQIIREALPAPAVGSLMTNGTGHCFIPVALSSAPGESSVMTLAEQVGPLTSIRNVFPGIPKNWKGIGLKTAYPDKYIYSCTPTDYSSPPYNITSFKIKNGSARPHRGDQSVYTSAMDVLINIKNPDATRLYYQKYDVECRNGIPISISEAGIPQYVRIKPGTEQVILRSATTEKNNFSGVTLENGAVYGVWENNSTQQQTAPANVEFFEWYDLSEETVRYTVIDGTLVTDDHFWYAMSSGYNEVNYIREDKLGGNFTIPYQAPGTDTTGKQLEHSDYSNYAECARLKSKNSVYSFFRKGKFGAYVTGKEVIPAESVSQDLP